MNSKKDYSEILKNRLILPRQGLLHTDTDLKNFALINYVIPKERLQPHIPDCFEIPEFEVEGKRMAMLSVVPFYDDNFRFSYIPSLKFRFFQTNFRAYIINKKTSEHVVWFFGTTLGSPIVKIPQALWNLPWHYAKYDARCEYDTADKKYKKYDINISSNWCDANIELEDTGEMISDVKGFISNEEMKLILTHPIKGYFYRTDGNIGTYSIWHEEMVGTLAKAKRIYFSLFERLNILTKDEMNNPHSIFLCPEIKFKICLPPRKFSAP